MLKLFIEQTLTEHYLTCFSADEKEPYIDIIWDMMEKAYAPIGGIKGLTKDELMSDNIIFKLVRKNNKIVACHIYNTKQGGRKIIGGCTDGTDIGKKAFYEMGAEEVKRIERNSWAEVSGAMEHIFLFKLGATPIPADIAKKILADKGKRIISTDPDGFHYTREIGGTPIEKIMFGNVPPKYRNTEDWEDEKTGYRTTFDKYVQTHPDEVANRKQRHLPKNKR